MTYDTVLQCICQSDNRYVTNGYPVVIDHRSAKTPLQRQVSNRHRDNNQRFADQLFLLILAWVINKREVGMIKTKYLIVSIAFICLSLNLSSMAQSSRRLAGSFHLGVAYGTSAPGYEDNAGGFNYGASIGFHPSIDWAVCLSVEATNLGYSMTESPPSPHPVDGNISDYSSVTLVGPEVTYFRPVIFPGLRCLLSGGFGMAFFSNDNHHFDDHYFSLGIGLQSGKGREGNFFIQMRVVSFFKVKSPTDMIPITAGIRF